MWPYWRCMMMFDAWRFGLESWVEFVHCKGDFFIFSYKRNRRSIGFSFEKAIWAQTIRPIFNMRPALERCIDSFHEKSTWDLSWLKHYSNKRSRQLISFSLINIWAQTTSPISNKRPAQSWIVSLIRIVCFWVVSWVESILKKKQLIYELN